MHYTDKSVNGEAIYRFQISFLISYKVLCYNFVQLPNIYVHRYTLNQLISPQYFASDIFDNPTAQIIPVYVYGCFRACVVFACP